MPPWIVNKSVPSAKVSPTAQVSTIVPLASGQLHQLGYREPGDAARGAGIVQVLRRLLKLRGAGHGRDVIGLPRYLKEGKHLFDDGATSVADDAENVGDLQIAQALDQTREQQHAQHEHDRDNHAGNERNRSRSAAIYPDKSYERVHECRAEHAERMKQRSIVGKPNNQPR